MIDALPLLLGPEGYQISRSVRLRASATAYLRRTNATTGDDPLKFTVSGWMKRGESTTYFPLLGSSTGSAAFDFIGFQADNFAFRIRNSSLVDVVQLISTAVFRDFSAWYHFVAVYDSANATSTERVKLYVNGVQITAFSTATYPSLNQAPTGDFLTDMQMGRTNTNSSNNFYGDGYITEVNFIDGQALDPSYFGETNSVTGVWQPKKYTGTYGTNGWYLNFSDNSAATAAAIGKDYSGNGNDWTPNNISLTAGVTYDSMLDVPTQWDDGGNGRGNYAVLNPLDSTYNPTEGGLSVVCGVTLPRSSVGSMFVSSGKWYMEVYCASNGGSANRFIIGLVTQSNSKTYPVSATDGVVYTAASGDLYVDGVLNSYGATYAQGNTIGIAVDFDLNEITFYKDNTSQGTYTGKTFSGDGYGLVVGHGSSAASSTFKINFGQQPFSYTPPTGFKALNTLNLPTPTILKGNQYFDVSLYSGNSSTQNITNSGAMQPDLVWSKSRSTAGTSHVLIDAVRGVNQALQSDLTNAEATFASSITAFNSDGFALGSSNQVNLSGRTYVGWQWKKGATQGFDIVTYTGTGVARTVAHNLGVKPSLIIPKARSNATNWESYHSALGATKYIALNLTNAAATASSVWDNTEPTSTEFTVGTSNGTNFNGYTYVAYLFAEVAGFSKFGSYTGNGSTDGVFVFCGFRPRFVMVKASNAAEGWVIWDSERNKTNTMQNVLYPNLSNAEGTNTQIDFLSNGFKLRNAAVNGNISGNSYIFAAFAEAPFKNSLAR